MSFLFGKTPQVNYQPKGFTSSGLSYNPGSGNITQSPALSSQIGQLQSTFGQAAGAFGGLAKTVAPGFSQFRQAGLSDIENARLSTMSSLRDNLAQRRILGSSFASSAIGQTEAEFAKQKADFEAQSYLQELDASNKLTQEQYQMATQQFAVGISQMNFESGLAAQLTQSMNANMAQIATANANLQAQSQAGMGKLLGVGAGLALAPFTGGASLAAVPGILAGGGGGGFSGSFGGSSTSFRNPFSTPLTNPNMSWT